MPLFAAVICISSFLLFQIQLLLAKYLLPWFGGTPSVFTGCMLFFQVMLFAGYAYAMGLTSRVRLGRQMYWHAGLLFLALAVLTGQFFFWDIPLLAHTHLRPQAGVHPLLPLLGILVLSVGVPFFALSATNTLLQHWFARSYPGQSPYLLFAFSNAGSLGGLLTYPFVVEPAFGLMTQAWLWAVAFLLFVLLMGVCGVMTRLASGWETPCAKLDEHKEAEPVRKKDWACWIGLPAISTMLLLASTQMVTQEVAVFPFLWVVPLSLYLLSFILVFANLRFYMRTLYMVLAFGSWAAITLFYLKPWTQWWDAPNLGFVWEVGLFMLGLFACCMFCHGELAKRKPPSALLGKYYLGLAGGGALGGLLAAAIAPMVFDTYWEFYLGYTAVFTLMLVDLLKAPWFWKLPGGTRWLMQNSVLVLVIGSLAVPHWHNLRDHRGLVAITRNFYGVVRVLERRKDHPEKHVYSLRYAGTEHGFQYRHPNKRTKPTAYYTPNTGAALAIQRHPRRALGMHIGLVGLGTGTMAAHAGPKDRISIYEINPAVIHLAEHTFTFLQDSKAEVRPIKTGDARQTLEQELALGQNQQFDLLMIDAFSGDAIPVHLLTLEAFSLYLKHLKKNGVLAVHVSNKYFDLAPVVWRLAHELNIHCTQVNRPKVEAVDAHSTVYLLLSNDPWFMTDAVIKKYGKKATNDMNTFPLWTDNYSNLFDVLYPEEYKLFD